MNPKEHQKDFNRRWNITSSPDSKKAFPKFKARILNIFNYIRDENDILAENPSIYIDKVITDKGIEQFCQHLGIRLKWQLKRIDLHKKNHSANIIDFFNNENNPIEFYRAIEVVLSLDFKQNDDRQEIIKSVKEAVEMSDINVAIDLSNNQYILYPQGEKKLDEELVNKTLLFLNKESNKHFEEALKFFQSKKPIKSAESLRRSLEEFLRDKLKNQKGLKENINCLQKSLKSYNSPSEIRNIIFQIFNYLDQYFNEHSKHGDGNINEAENEFLIYQTGLLLRYINKIQAIIAIKKGNENV